MIRKLAISALVVALGAPLSSAKAVGTQAYDVCGGSYAGWSGFAFCASVQVTVVQKAASVWNVALQISNMSGYNGSFAGSVFTQIGIDNIPGNLASPANITISQGGSVVCANKFNDPSSASGCWDVLQDANATGGFNVDFLAQSAYTRPIGSACEGTDFLQTCYAAQPIMIAFDINANFNPVTQGQVYLRAETTGDAPMVTECETGASVVLRERCVAGQTFSEAPPVVATPEPATLVLMGTGLLVGLPVARWRRRKVRASEV